jgi:hypothetical protein
MSNLRPEPRMNKLGHVVVKHVKDNDADAASAKLSGVAPVIPSSAPVADYRRSIRATSMDAHHTGRYGKMILTSGNKQVDLSASSLPEGVDASTVEVKVSNYSGIDLTADEEAEVKEASRVFAHEVAALEASKADNIPIAAELVPEGAYIDLNGCAYVDPADWDEHSFAYAEVEEVEEGPEGEIILHTDQGSVALPPDYALPVQRAQLNDTVAETYSQEQIDDMTRAALSSALEDASFMEADNEEEEDEDDYSEDSYAIGSDAYREALTIENVSPETFAKFRERVEKFVTENAWAVSASGRNPESLGHEFFMTASHSGVGFTDRDDIPMSVRNALARAINENDKAYSLEHGVMTVGDDGKVFFEG